MSIEVSGMGRSNPNHRRRCTVNRMFCLVLLLAFVVAAAASTDEGNQGMCSLHLIQEAYAECNGAHNNRRRLDTQRTVYRPQSSRQEACMDNVEEASTAVQLQFIYDKLETPIYTHKKISAGNGQPVDVAICRDGQVITSGPLSSVNVEIVALPGDFGREGNWTAEDFDRQIVISRDGQDGSVLERCCVRRLINGKISFDGIRFKEGSSRTRTRQFTLAARVVRGEDTGGLRVREAIMDPVTVKDQRSEANEKSDPPKLNHEVYRLKGIGGHYFQKLQQENIKTVQDFLKAYNRDPERLRNILKINSYKSKCWEKMTKHAMDCDLGDMNKLKQYKTMTEGGIVVLFFNCVHDLVGAEFRGSYVAKDKFDNCQKAAVDGLKEQAHNELEGIELDYVMKDSRPVKIFTSINVAGHPPFLMPDAIPQPNPSYQHQTYQAADNLGPDEMNQHVPQTLPEPANCSIAAVIPRAGGSEPYLLDHNHAYVNEGLAPTRWDSLRASVAWGDGPSFSSFYSPDMMATGTHANATFRASDLMNQPMFTPSPTYGTSWVPRSGQDNFNFYGNNQFEASTSTQNNLLSSYQDPGLDYQPGWETDLSQAGGILPVDNVPPYIIQDPSQTHESEVGRPSFAGTSTYISSGSLRKRHFLSL